MQEKNASRLLSLDVFRGLTIALMIVVNSPGNQTPYPFLEHAPWIGCTLADLVFPFFIFIVGVSTVFSLSKMLERQPENEKAIIIKILNRSVLVFCIGLCLNAFPNHFDFSSIRVFGVLQRIAICYFFSAILYLKTTIRTQALILSALLVGYWLVMSLPSFNLTAEGNLAAYIDQLLLTSAHLYGKLYDPEGFLSTFPAIATALLGNLTGDWLLSSAKAMQKRNGLFLLGILACLIGWFWSLWFPINKTLWTSSYALWTGGLALLTFTLCYWLIEIKRIVKWSKPFEIFGVNAMVAYVLHVVFLKIQALVKIQRPNGTSLNLKFYLTDYLFSWTPSETAALFYALTYSLLWLFILTILYRKKIFIKI